MLITEKSALMQFADGFRLWQGIPGIEVTRRGRSFLTFYSGGTTEEIGNYVLLLQADNGKDFNKIVAAARLEGHRCYDPCLWIDPLGRLWLIWSVQPDHAVYAAVCDDPDADALRFGEEFPIGHDVMLNKPIVLSSGEWLFPVAVWSTNVHAVSPQYDTKQPVRGSFVYKTVDNGKTFTKLGCADVPHRSFDEHMLLELADGRIMMLVRTDYGIGVSYSFDRGTTWTPGCDSALGGPCSRFHIRRLRSGRILLINHCDDTNRNNLTAMLSEDEGKTWPYRLLLDERDQVSYPDATQTADGSIYIVYDRERGAFSPSLEAAYSSAREILTARITEEDILQGRLVHPQSYLKHVANRLGTFKGNAEAFFAYTNGEIAKRISRMDTEAALEFLFKQFPLNCTQSHKASMLALDRMIDKYRSAPHADAGKLLSLVSAFRAASNGHGEPSPIVERIKNILAGHLLEPFSAADLARQLGISMYYMCHLFKQATGITMQDYRNALRLFKAKRLLIETNDKIADIAGCCGYGDASYFTRAFKHAERMSPSLYRKLHQRGVVAHHNSIE